MLEFIVLGNMPGTRFTITFSWVLFMVAVALAIFEIRYHRNYALKVQAAAGATTSAPTAKSAKTTKKAVSKKSKTATKKPKTATTRKPTVIRPKTTKKTASKSKSKSPRTTRAKA
jgi:Na+(H+)/acetate symporter ActP